jgi:riboflavin synthase
MFTGIVESMGSILSVTAIGTNRVFWIESTLSGEFKVDQSVSHNGVCLTVEEVKDGRHRVTAIEETLRKTDLGAWETGRLVNLERSMLMNGRLDGHIVQGHADCTAVCLDKKALEGSWEFRFQFPGKFAPLVIEKGSISVNGISLTLFNISRNEFSVAIIPYTFQHTNIKSLSTGALVNIEFDIIGKYVLRNNTLAAIA